MSRWDSVRTVAWWEFRRFFKIRDQLLALLLGFVVGGIAFLFKSAADADRETVHVVVVNTSALQLPPRFEEWLHFDDQGERPLNELELALERKEIDGILHLRNPDDAELIVRKEPYWEAEMRQVLNQTRGRERLGRSNFTEAQLIDVLSPLPLKVTIAKDGVQPHRKAEKFLATLFVILTMLGIWMGFAFFLIGITGEKQLRVTEQVVAAISPQTWIDGKLIGLTGVALASMGTYLIAGTVTITLLILSGIDIPIPAVAGSPALIFTFFTLAVLGIFFWNCFFGMVSATINDPYTSARGSLMMLPLMPVLFAGLSTSKPDALWMKILGVIPGFSSAILPSRMVLTDVAWWEPLTAIGLLLVGIWCLRRLAGKVFAAGILIHGKEPTLREVWHWLRQA